MSEWEKVEESEREKKRNRHVKLVVITWCQWLRTGLECCLVVSEIWSKAVPRWSRVQERRSWAKWMAGSGLLPVHYLNNDGLCWKAKTKEMDGAMAAWRSFCCHLLCGLCKWHPYKGGAQILCVHFHAGAAQIVVLPRLHVRLHRPSTMSRPASSGWQARLKQHYLLSKPLNLSQNRFWSYVTCLEVLLSLTH